MANKVVSSASIDEYNNNIYVGDDSGNMTCFDLRDGKTKWSYQTGGSVQSTPAFYNDTIAFTSNDGSLYILNKFSGKENMTYGPGYYLFNSKITSSPVIIGNTLILTANDGNVYSLNLLKQITPISVYVWYDIIIIIVLIIIIGVLISLNKKRKAKKPIKKKQYKKFQ